MEDSGKTFITCIACNHLADPDYRGLVVTSLSVTKGVSNQHFFPNTGQLPTISSYSSAGYRRQTFRHGLKIPFIVAVFLAAWFPPASY